MAIATFAGKSLYLILRLIQKIKRLAGSDPPQNERKATTEAGNRNKRGFSELSNNYFLRFGKKEGMM